MTVLNPENKELLTIGEALDPAMKITDPEDAKQYKAAYVAYLQKHQDKEGKVPDMTAEEIANANLGYYAGYHSNEVRKRIEKLFNCAHPVFGSIKENGVPTPKQAFEMGKKLSEQLKNQ